MSCIRRKKKINLIKLGTFRASRWPGKSPAFRRRATVSSAAILFAAARSSIRRFGSRCNTTADELVSLVAWISKCFKGDIHSSTDHALLVKFVSTQNKETWFLACVYGPCSGQERDNFVSWLRNFQMDQDDVWLFLGDFNLISIDQLKIEIKWELI